MSIVLNPETEREPVSVHIAFDPTEAQGGGFLPLYDESLPMPRLLLPPEVEARLCCSSATRSCASSYSRRS